MYITALGVDFTPWIRVISQHHVYISVVVGSRLDMMRPLSVIVRLINHSMAITLFPN